MKFFRFRNVVFIFRNKFQKISAGKAMMKTQQFQVASVQTFCGKFFGIIAGQFIKILFFISRLLIFRPVGNRQSNITLDCFSELKSWERLYISG